MVLRARPHAATTSSRRRRTASGLALAAVVVAAAALASCKSKGESTPAPPDSEPTAASPLRRLSAREYANTVRDLFPKAMLPALQFPPDAKLHGFDNNADVQTASPVLIEDYDAAARAVATAAMTDAAGTVGCAPTSTDEEKACAATFIDTFGKQAYRRPLDDGERQRLVQFFDTARAESDDFAGAMTLVITAILESPQFLFRVEVGSPATTDGTVTLTPYEIAVRLSYFLTGSLPDAELFASADAGKLADPAELAAQATRLLATKAARTMVRDFAHQWLDLDRVATANKDVGLFPLFSTDLLTDLTTETEMFAEHTVFDGDGTLPALLTDSRSFVNTRLAGLYGVPPPADPGFVLTALDPAQRAGVLTQGSFLAGHGHAKLGSPVLRGLAISRSLLCFDPPPPPPTVNTGVAQGATGGQGQPKTTRDLFVQHLKSPGCKSCHITFDIYGYALEGFDAIGAFRTTENGYPVDTTSDVGDLDGDGKDVNVEGAVDLAHKLADSPRVHACVTKQWFRYAYGRAEGTSDVATLKETGDAFTASGLRFDALLLAIVKSPAFVTRAESK